ncbi:hypothetical protein D5086_024527 [Populus alba]|uniref:Uncharacterized protein n=1 Tax=Populus alba TaxID=43335 RepID=A0ACC4B5P1_POPAL
MFNRSTLNWFCNTKLDIFDEKERPGEATTTNSGTFKIAVAAQLIFSGTFYRPTKQIDRPVGGCGCHCKAQNIEKRRAILYTLDWTKQTIELKQQKNSTPFSALCQHRHNNS